MKSSKIWCLCPIFLLLAIQLCVSDEITEKSESAAIIAKSLVQKYRDASSYTSTIKIKELRSLNASRQSSFFVALQRPNLIFIRETHTRPRQKLNFSRQFVCDGKSWIYTNTKFPNQHRKGNALDKLFAILENFTDGFGNAGEAVELFTQGRRFEDIKIITTKKIRGISAIDLYTYSSEIFRGDMVGNATGETYSVTVENNLLSYRNEKFDEGETIDRSEKYFNIAFNRDIPKSLFRVVIPTGSEQVEEFHNVKK